MSKKYIEWEHLSEKQLFGRPEEQKDALICQVFEELKQARKQLRAIDSGREQRARSLPLEDDDG